MTVDEKREAQVHLRLTKKEAALMRERANAAGLGLSAYVRRVALTGGDPMPVIDVRELRALYAELRRCGNNANQIARMCNTYGASAAIAADASSALAALERAADSISEAIKSAIP